MTRPYVLSKDFSRTSAPFHAIWYADTHQHEGNHPQNSMDCLWPHARGDGGRVGVADEASTSPPESCMTGREIPKNLSSAVPSSSITIRKRVVLIAIRLASDR